MSFEIWLHSNFVSYKLRTKRCPRPCQAQPWLNSHHAFSLPPKACAESDQPQIELFAVTTLPTIFSSSPALSWGSAEGEC